MCTPCQQVELGDQIKIFIHHTTPGPLAPGESLAPLENMHSWLPQKFGSPERSFAFFTDVRKKKIDNRCKLGCSWPKNTYTYLDRRLRKIFGPVKKYMFVSDRGRKHAFLAPLKLITPRKHATWPGPTARGYVTNRH